MQRCFCSFTAASCFWLLVEEDDRRRGENAKRKQVCPRREREKIEEALFLKGLKLLVACSKFEDRLKQIIELFDL